MNLSDFLGASKYLCESPREPEPMGKVSVVYSYLIGFLLVGIVGWLGWEMEAGFWAFRMKQTRLLERCLMEGYPFENCYNSFIN